MVRFRNNRQSPRNYLSRREQRRLLVLVFMLGLVLLAMHEARQPQNWRWLWTLGNRRADATAASARPAGAAEEALDHSTGRVAAADGVIDRTQAFFPGVNPEYLKSVEDNTVFRKSGRDAWLNLLDVLHAQDAQTLEAASSGNVGYLQLLKQPDQYRGRLVSLGGLALRCLPVEAVPNELGIRRYYQISMRCAGGPARAVIVYCLDPPANFPTGEQIRQPIELTGFFFKNLAFTDGQQMHVAPTLLARTIDWTPTQPSNAAKNAVPTVSLGALTVLVGIAAAVAGLCIWFVNRRAGPAGPRRSAAEDDAATGNCFDK